MQLHSFVVVCVLRLSAAVAVWRCCCCCLVLLILLSVACSSQIPGNKIFKQQGTRKIRLGEDSGVVFTGGAGGSGSSAPAPASSGPAGGAGKPKGKGKAAAAPGSDDEGAVAKGFDDDVELVKSTVAADDI